MSIEAPIVSRHRRPWPRALAGVGVVAVIGAGLGAYLGIRAVQGAGSAVATGQPPARTNGAMAFDAADGTVVLFGGEGKSGGSAIPGSGTGRDGRRPIRRPRRPRCPERR